MVDPEHSHADELVHRTRTMALGLVASFAGGALLILGLGGSKAVAALVFTVGLVAGGLAVRHAPPDLTEQEASPHDRAPVPAAVTVPTRAPERERAPVIVAPTEEDEIDLTVAAPAVDAVVQALADLRDEASATEALLARVAERRAGGRATAPGAIRGMTSTNAPAPPLS